MSVTATTELQFFWENRSIGKDFQTGVSLHSHTMYSQETLAMVPRWAARAVGAGALADGFWRPPLSPRQAYRLEQKQIEKQLDLSGLVSLSDHDDMRAGRLLRVMDRFRDAPVSTEWTVPFGPTFFHVGVHNLRLSRAAAIMGQLTQFTTNPCPHSLTALLEMLHSDPGTLVVVNHPLWDEKGIGQAHHASILRTLLTQGKNFIHALEVNGLRSLEENRRVVRLGRELDLPVVAGGDRHGLEPNAIVNLSRARTIADFISEVRYDRFSHVVFMPQYQRPRRLRIAEMVLDVLRQYPDFEGRQSWRDRVFCRDSQTALIAPLTAYPESRGCRILGHLLAATRWLDRREASAILTSA